MTVCRLCAIHLKQRQFFSGRQRLGVPVSNRRLLIIAAEASMSDGDVEQNGEGQLEELDGERDAERSPAQLIGVVQQAAAGLTRRRVAISLPQTTSRVDYRSEQHGCRDIT